MGGSGGGRRGGVVVLTSTASHWPFVPFFNRDKSSRCGEAVSHQKDSEIKTKRPQEQHAAKFSPSRKRRKGGAFLKGKRPFFHFPLPDISARLPTKKHFP